MYQKLLRAIYAIEQNSVLSSIKKSFILIIPILLTGSIALLIQSFPLLALQSFLQTAFGGFFYSLLGYLFDSTVGFMSAYLSLGISYYYSATLKTDQLSLRVMAMIVSFSCFVASFGAASGSLALTHFGPVGVFTAIVSSIVSTRLFFFFCSHTTRIVHTYTNGSDINYRNSVVAILPLFLCVTVFVLINLLINLIFHVANFNDLISNALVSLFHASNGDLGNGIIFTLLLNLLWVFGIHGGNALEQVSQTLFVPAINDPSAIVSKSFLDNFAQIGGSGATLCLLLALLICSRSKSNRQLAKSAAPLAFFNINEILVFGLPIVFNPVMLIPFICVPLLSLLISYFATAVGLMPIVMQSVTWTTPFLFSGYLATGSISGAVVQLVIVAAGSAIYIPFIRLSESIQQNREVQMIGELTKTYFQSRATGLPFEMLNRHDELGAIAKTMMTQLRTDIDDDRVPVFYQPQVDLNGRISGAEALLRWQYAGQSISPPLVIALTQEDGCFDKLTSCILHRVHQDIQELRNACGSSIMVSVNITAEQLNNTPFIRRIVELSQQAGVIGNFSLEVTEESSLSLYGQIEQNIELLKSSGIPMAIDDFSMGHTSLKYLQNNNFRYVKLDGELVRQLVSNPRSREIVQSIVALGKSLDFQVIAEYVETAELREELINLGCDRFQGYLYSPALPVEAFLEYAMRLSSISRSVP